MKNISTLEILCIFFLAFMVSISACCDCLEPCEEEIQVVSIVEPESLDWFEYYENSSDTVFVSKVMNQSYYINEDTLVIEQNIDTIQFITTDVFTDDARCIQGCPSVCERREASGFGVIDLPGRFVIPQMIISAGAFIEPGTISIEVVSPFRKPHNKSYRFSLRNTGEILEDYQVLEFETVNGKRSYQAVSQEENDRVEITRIDEYIMNGVTHLQCYEIIDSISYSPESFDYFKVIFSKTDGPLLFEHHNLYRFPEVNETSVELHRINRLE